MIGWATMLVAIRPAGVTVMLTPALLVAPCGSRTEKVRLSGPT
jgi:hypothetical protein